jgi:DNA-binding NtrC family response regulator
LKVAAPRTEVVVLVAPGDGHTAAAAMRGGAYHVLASLSAGEDAFAHVVANAAAYRRLADRAHRLEELLLSEERFGEVARGSAPGVLDLFRLVVHLADRPYAEAKRALLEHFDGAYTSELLERTGGNMSAAARRAGLDRSNFRRLLKRHRTG